MKRSALITSETLHTQSRFSKIEKSQRNLTCIAGHGRTLTPTLSLSTRRGRKRAGRAVHVDPERILISASGFSGRTLREGDEDTFFVPDDDVGDFVAVEVPYRDLGADA